MEPYTCLSRGRSRAHTVYIPRKKIIFEMSLTLQNFIIRELTLKFDDVIMATLGPYIKQVFVHIFQNSLLLKEGHFIRQVADIEASYNSFLKTEACMKAEINDIIPRLLVCNYNDSAYGLARYRDLLSRAGYCRAVLVQMSDYRDSLNMYANYTDTRRFDFMQEYVYRRPPHMDNDDLRNAIDLFMATVPPPADLELDIGDDDLAFHNELIENALLSIHTYPSSS